MMVAEKYVQRREGNWYVGASRVEVYNVIAVWRRGYSPAPRDRHHAQPRVPCALARCGARRLRHRDHRFEWTRAECQAWAERVAAAYGYRAACQELGPADPTLGAPSQLVIFDRLDDARIPAPEQTGE